jgi:hypothetical protein
VGAEVKRFGHCPFVLGLLLLGSQGVYGDPWSDAWETITAPDEVGTVGEQLIHEFYGANDPLGTTNLLPKLDPTKSGPDGLFRLPDGTVRIHEVKTSRGGWPGRGVLWTEVSLDGRRVEVQQLDDRWIDAWVARVRNANPPSATDLRAAEEVVLARREGRLLRVFDEVYGVSGQIRSSVAKPFAGALMFEEKLAAVEIKNTARLTENRMAFAELRQRQRQVGAVMTEMETLVVSEDSLRKGGINAYDEVVAFAKLSEKRVVPGLLAADGALLVGLQAGAIEGGLVFATEAGIAGYRYVKGDTLRADFLTEVSDAAIKGAAVGSATAVAVVLAPAGPAGWIVAGVGIGTYVFVDSSVKTWHEYSNRKYVTLDDLKGFGVDVQSVFAQGGKLIPDSGPLVPSTPLLPTTSVLQPLGN